VVHALVLVAAGLGAGFLSGLAGMGGAFVLVPVLAFGTGMPFKAATGAAVLHGLGTAVSAWMVHRRRGVVEQRVGLIGGAGGVAGGLAGALISAIVSALAVKVIYAATVLLALLLLVARPEPDLHRDVGNARQALPGPGALARCRAGCPRQRFGIAARRQPDPPHPSAAPQDVAGCGPPGAAGADAVRRSGELSSRQRRTRLVADS
jgi:uncharacterized membrane protein YfcA